MDEKQKKIFQITEAVEKQINSLLSKKISGKIQLTVELNVTQGFLASADLRNDSRENIFKS